MRRREFGEVRLDECGTIMLDAGADKRVSFREDRTKLEGVRWERRLGNSNGGNHVRNFEGQRRMQGSGRVRRPVW